MLLYMVLTIAFVCFVVTDLRYKENKNINCKHFPTTLYKQKIIPQSGRKSSSADGQFESNVLLKMLYDNKN